MFTSGWLTPYRRILIACLVFFGFTVAPVAAQSPQPLVEPVTVLSAEFTVTIPDDEPMSHMQASTLTVRVQWDPNAAAEVVTSYGLGLDAAAPIVVPPIACTAVLCEQPLTVALGSHTFTVTATNQWGPSSPTSLTQVIAPPLPPKNVRIVK